MKEKIYKYLLLIKYCLIIFLKRKRYGQLYFFIYTPSYGNVGDHTIVLAEKELFTECKLGRKNIEITSLEYNLLKDMIKPLIHSTDIIILDGGGNFGDTWEETLLDFCSIIEIYNNNKIFVFPESWFFSESLRGKQLLQKTINVLKNHKNIIIYARDSWSYYEMKKNLKFTQVKYAYDCVLYKQYNRKKIENNSNNGFVGICVRDDKESVNTITCETINNFCQKCGYTSVVINNDLYQHIRKHKRKKFFYSKISEYEKCDFIITDRFHGFIFSIILEKPCIVVDNLTGKIKHFYEDIAKYLTGCLFLQCNERNIDNLVSDFLNSKYKKLCVSNEFYENVIRYKNLIKIDLKGWNKNEN